MLHEINTMLALDFYKSDHRRQYPENTELVYSNFTPRKSRVEGVDEMVFFGLDYAIQEYLIDRMNTQFFHKPKDEVVDSYIRRMDNALGKGAIDREHIEALHDLGYVPLLIKALPEGTKVPMGVPAFTMYNTHKDFAWVTNYFETLLSSLIWKPCTSATTAHQFRNLFDKYAKLTGADSSAVDFQGHDFSFRGMSGFEDACMSGAAHLLSFKGTDTVPAIDFLEMFYAANSDREFVGGSVAATEHSVMCAGGMESELETIRRLLRLYPTGILSVVSDTWDFWKVVTEYLPILKDEIVARWERDPNSKLVIRPDSGVPHQILNGAEHSSKGPQNLGLIGCLGNIFGYTVNEKGYKRLHPCIGAIYGDGINMEEATRILSGLENSGWESTSVVLGLGSYTYQYVTRDTYGTVCKATYCEIDGESYPIFKSPKTGAWKKSHKGLLRVNSDLTVSEDVSWDEEKGGLLQSVFVDGVHLHRNNNLSEIRERIKNGSC